MSNFDDLFAANTEFVKEFKSQDLTGEAKKGLAIVTCMDSRIDPLRIIGMKAGDAKKLRNAEIFTWLCLALCTVQIIFGTELRESVDQQAAFWNQTNRGSWVTLSGEVFNIHKGFSFLLTLATIICSGYMLEHFKEIKRLISYVMVIITIMALQIITGIVLAYFNLPPAMQTLHLFFASLLIGAWMLQLALLVNYRKSISMAIII